MKVQVDGHDREFINLVSSQYIDFIQPGGESIDLKLTLSHDSWPEDTEDISIEKINNSYILAGEKFECLLDTQARSAAVRIIKELTHFNTFLRVFYSQVLVFSEGFMVHAAGLIRNNRAYLFAGPSESGKTTTAKRANGFDILSDELVIIRRINNIFFLYSTPFSGEYTQRIKNLKAPLSNIFFLNKRLKTGLVSKSSLSSFIDLLENIFFFDQEKDSSQFILGLSSRLTAVIESFDINILSYSDLGRFVDGLSKGAEANT
ncbi:MAG: hypothetical protein JW867_04350 [Candidatus Omnitrophica bacterium]|nr:hypothetical protein [Candidatus Omnitrophota bacterium]